MCIFLQGWKSLGFIPHLPPPTPFCMSALVLSSREGMFSPTGNCSCSVSGSEQSWRWWISQGKFLLMRFMAHFGRSWGGCCFSEWEMEVEKAVGNAPAEMFFMHPHWLKYSLLLFSASLIKDVLGGAHLSTGKEGRVVETGFSFCLSFDPPV